MTTERVQPQFGAIVMGIVVRALHAITRRIMRAPLR
jgi:hypothetical protein